jgi:hypothetical protein
MGAPQLDTVLNENRREIFHQSENGVFWPVSDIAMGLYASVLFFSQEKVPERIVTQNSVGDGG